jgi:outer membrane biosynthesis protein TonB
MKLLSAIAIGVIGPSVVTMQLASQSRGGAPQSQPAPQRMEAGFVPPRLVSAWPIEYPIRSIAAGVVVLEVLIDDNGKVVDAIARRDIPSLTEAALPAVKHWEYKAAMRDGEPVWSRATVAVMFNPPITASPVELSPPTSEIVTHRHRYPPEPPDIALAIPATYPFGYTGIDLSVVLNVDIAADGGADAAEVIHGEKPLTDTAQAAVKKWQFRAAHNGGKAISAPMTVAFVYRVPVTN